MSQHDTGGGQRSAGQQGQPGDTAQEMHAGDQVPPGTEGAGENICPDCGGSGRREGVACTTCGGTGRVVETIGGE